ncbi:MAG: alpha/beta fold hydrolase, partial [Propionibacteriaceae bacterium]
DLPLFLVGHSLGGLVTQQAIVCAPEQFRAAVMMCSGSEGIALRGRELNPVTVGRLDAFVEMAQDRDIHQLWDDMATVQGIDMNNPFSRFLQERFVGSSKQALVTFAHALGYTPDLADAVIASKVPVRWCFGADDGSWDQSLQCEAAHRYGTEPVVIPEAMHSPMFENTDATVEVLDGFFAEFVPSA